MKGEYINDECNDVLPILRLLRLREVIFLSNDGILEERQNGAREQICNLFPNVLIWEYSP